MNKARTDFKKLPPEESIEIVVSVLEHDEAIHFSSRLKQLEKGRRMGLLSSETYWVERRQLDWGWLNYISTLTDSQIAQITAKSYLRLNPEVVLTKLTAASFRLDEWLGDFKTLPNSHLDRPETQQILDWIVAPTARDEMPIALLVGGAGSGKSVVMRDLLRLLQASGTPVLGIKADQYCVEDIPSLQKRLELDDDLEATTRALVGSHERVVLLIDQIDALSQSLSARGEYLEPFERLARMLAEIEGVRVVVSCREYDLQNDRRLSFYRRQRNFSMGKLERVQAERILQRLSPAMPKLPEELFELLRTPLHLNIFCQIYRPGLTLAGIRALHDLYTEYWFQKVVEIEAPAEMSFDPAKVPVLVHGLARAMNEEQKLVVAANLFRSEFSKELDHLKSTGILLEEKEGVLFFHQTFYEFAFAKQFVESGAAVEDYITDNDQSLHIRSSLKMMMEFLRGDHKRQLEYLRVLRAILPDPTFLYHIKSLLLSLLGFVKEPRDEEMLLVRELVLGDATLFKAFVSSVKSGVWLGFLLEEGRLERLVEPLTGAAVDDEIEQERFNSRAGMLAELLVRHLPECRKKVLGFVADLPVSRSKDRLVERTLFNLNIWDEPLAFKLYGEIDPKIDDYARFHFLEDAANNRQELPWVFRQLNTITERASQTEDLRSNGNMYDFQLRKLISQLSESFPEETLDLLFGWEMARLKKLESLGLNPEPGSIVHDFFMVDFDFEGEPSDLDKEKIFKLLLKTVRRLAANGSTRFSSFIAENNQSLSETRLLILVEGFRAAPAMYVNQIARLFRFFMEKRGFDNCYNLSRQVRKLLAQSIPYLSPEQKAEFIQLVSQIESKREKEWAEERGSTERIGETRLLWLKCLPEADLEKFPAVGDDYRQLVARFPDLKEQKPSRFRMRAIGPPLERSEYETMTLDDWRESFYKITEEYVPEFGSYKGGKAEHARQFEAEIKKRPDFFYPLIEELTTLDGIPKTYLSHGLNALKEAGIAPERLLQLLKKVRLDGFENWEVRQLTSLCGQFSNYKIEDDFVIEFLARMAATHPDPMDEKLTVRFEKDLNESINSTGFNSVRGHATHLLPYFFYFKKHEDLIFKTLEQVAETDLLAVRCQAVQRLALLTNLDPARTMRLFLRLVRDGEAAVMEQSTWSAQYLARQDFGAMRPYFENALAHPPIHQNIGIILSLEWLAGHEEALTLLDRFVAAGDEAKAGAIGVAAHNIGEEDSGRAEKSLALFERFLGEAGDTVVHAYDIAFNELKAADFPRLQPVLVRYARTVAARKNPRPFYEYLINCARKHPKECLELAESFSGFESQGYYDSEPLKVVNNAYNALWRQKPRDREMLKHALLIFDQMLLDDRFSRDAETVLKNVEG